MNSLFAKLSAALLIIVALMGTAFFVLDRINTRAYYDELSQRLNAPIAMYVTEQRQLIGAVRTGEHLGEIQHADAGEWCRARHDVPLRFDVAI